MEKAFFDLSSSDSQGTLAEPVSPADFDMGKYADYRAVLEERCGRFWAASGGILVHRRFRVPQVFAGQCGDMETSLALQLGALKKSMDYAMDVPNFLEPWYGIGAVPAAYGAEYQWHGENAPATAPLFNTLEEALAHEPREIEETPVGRHIINMINYFMEKTRGLLPLSLSDVQSPLNAAAALVDTSEFYAACIEEPELTEKLLDRVCGLTIRFCKKQAAIIGENLVFPGHGFSSCRSFGGAGFSDDNSIMLSPETHRDLCGPSMRAFADAFGGFAFHSCGDWSGRTETVKDLPGLKMVDGAFSPRTDPAPNPPGPFRASFAGTGICVNARAVGSAGEVLGMVKELYGPGMKLIVVTYCPDPGEQDEVYRGIHELFEDPEYENSR
ncbi:MAG: hypothetical protein LBT93_09425 [Treponema sp.]|jgi:hypothetical protein|nr:hypothetical protein [Treponema sp.]